MKANSARISAMLAGTLAVLFVAVTPVTAQPTAAELMVEGAPLPSVDGSAFGASPTAFTGPYRRNPGPAAGPSRVAKVDLSFDGFGFDDNRTETGFLFIPPDPIGAAGTSRIVAVVNSMIEVRTKGGKLKWRDGLRDFFGSLEPASNPFDPKVVYDDYANRFVVVALELQVGSSPSDPNNVSRILLAVSKSANPKNARDWWFEGIDAKTTIFGSYDGWADYPGFEVDEEAVYVTANIFTFVPFGYYGGSRIWIVDKGRGAGGFYDGGPASFNRYDPYVSPDSAPTTTMPAQVQGYGGVGGPGSTVGTFLVSYSGLTDGMDEYIQVVTIDDPLGQSGGPFFLQEFVNIGSIESVPPWPALPDAPQLGSPYLIEVNDRRALDAVWRDGKLWVTTTIIPEAGPEAGQTTAHWVRIDTQSGPYALILDDQGDIGGEDIAPGTYTFFPSVAVNRWGHAAFGFAASAPTIYAGAYVAGRKEGDADGTVRASFTIRAGEGPYKRFFGGARNRWGDYTGISTDPNNDDFFWVFNQYADVPGTPTTGSQGDEDGRWGTAWGRFKF